MTRIASQPPQPTFHRRSLGTRAAAAAALLLVPASTLCAADLRYSFTYSDPITQATGVLTAHDNRNGTISAVAGTLSVFAGPLLGTYALLENLTGAAVVYSPMRWFLYDDLLFPSAPAKFDIYGLLFADSAREINLGRNRSGPGYSLRSAQADRREYSGDSGTLTFTSGDLAAKGSPVPVSVPGPGVPVVLAGAGIMLWARRRR